MYYIIFTILLLVIG